ncbi:hypothetical protein KR093_005775 [Drosophila rubida]|uniref:BOD1/SHG1 domain-containing protein n=1 Tax=Drosophila rubida TaxID=30044 RepID=A0AAD4KC75_9MUSC|nr:hypothetical protein KR093_005775 [Drosophila rubida]
MDNFVKTLIEEVKSQGVFDEFRFNCCLADVDTKPAYQNVRNRVETAVNDFLAKQHWTPDTNKVQLRERLRKHLLDSDVLDKGVDHIVDQVVNPKVATVFEPKIESIAYKYLGIAPPPPPAYPPPRPPLLPAPPLPPYAGHGMGHMNGGGNMLQVETTGGLLPTDLEQISPDSDRATIKSDLKEDSKEEEELPPPGVDDDDMDYDDTTSPAFEPTSSLKDDLNNGSLNTSDSLKDVKELANDSRDAGASQASQLSQVSSDSRLTIASTDAQQSAAINNSNIAANISEEAQMPKFNENSSETHESSGRQLHFDIKQDAITFEGTERRNSLTEQINGGSQALCIEDAIMSEMKANLIDVNSVVMEATPTPPPMTVKTEPSAENNFSLFTEATQPKDSSTATGSQLPEVPEIKPELTKLEEMKTEALPATQELKEDAIKPASPASASSSSQTKKPSHSSDKKDRDKDKDKRHHSDDKRRKSRDRERERERDRDREHDKSRSKTSSSSKHSSRSSHSSSSKHRSSSSSKHDKNSSSRSGNHESSTSKRSSSTRHDSSSSSSHKKHKSSSSSSKSREQSHSHNSSHSSHHHSRNHNGSGSSTSNSKRSDRDRDRDRDRERNKSSSNSTNSASNSINPPAAPGPTPAIIQDDHNEVKAKLQKRHSHDSNDEGKPPGAASKPQTADAAVESHTKEKPTNGKATEANGSNGTNGSSPADAAPEIVDAGHVVIVSDMLQQSSASFIELSSAKPVEEQHKPEADAKPTPQAEELKAALEPTAETESTAIKSDLTATTALNEQNDVESSQLGEQNKVEAQLGELNKVEDATSTDTKPSETLKTEESKANAADTESTSQPSIAVNAEQDSKEDIQSNSTTAAQTKCSTPVESLKEAQCAEAAEPQEASETCTHFEESAEEFKARLLLIEQHIKDRRTLLNVFCGVEEDSSQPARRNSVKRRLSSEASSSKRHTTSCSSGSSSSGSPNAKAKRAKMSPTPSEISVNSKENEELDKQDKGELSARRLSQKLCQQQRYTNDDLYKPRPLLSHRSRRRGLDAIL